MPESVPVRSRRKPCHCYSFPYREALEEMQTPSEAAAEDAEDAEDGDEETARRGTGPVNAAEENDDADMVLDEQAPENAEGTNQSLDES
jgi:hypothetical protein